jgi:phosphopantothenoylcysteine decarboxylase/phosphopantothenate--cysteine ligase
MSSLQNKRIVLGVTGSIAAYKTPELVRRLREAGATVRVVMSRSAAEFVTPMSLQVVSGNPVQQALMDPQAELAMGHIELARWADLVLVAPASADCLARLAQGRADDLLTAVCLATDAVLAVAPAMNRLMWENPVTLENCSRLLARGIRFFGPDEGEQACGETGPGRMLEVDELRRRCESLFETGSLAGLRVLVTAGPTREPIDPVRYLGNRSSGKMGYAVAAAAAEAGAEVILVSGPTGLPAPERVTRVDVETAQQMYERVMAEAGSCDLVVGVAAVADYRPVNVQPDKIKKQSAGLVLELERTADIISAVARLEPAPFVVGFAAETQDVTVYARDKLQRKGLDMIAANRVGEGIGFGQEDNELRVVWPQGESVLPRAKKDRLARQLVELIAERFHAKDRIKDN